MSDWVIALEIIIVAIFFFCVLRLEIARRMKQKAIPPKPERQGHWVNLNLSDDEWSELQYKGEIDIKILFERQSTDWNAELKNLKQ